MSDQTQGSSADTGPDAKRSADDTANAIHVDAPRLVPDQDAASDAAKDAPVMIGKLMLMAPSRSNAGERNRDDVHIDPESLADDADEPAGNTGGRRLSAFAAVVALATVAGAIGGAMATVGVLHFAGGSQSQQASAADQLRGQDDTIMRIEADLAALKTNIDRTAKTSLAQFGKANDRFDKVEKAQAEPAAKLAKLSETVEKMRVAAATPAPAPAPIPAPAPVAAAPAHEVTGSISPPAAVPALKPEVARMPTVDGWVLRDVDRGAAVIEGRAGIFEVYAGDPVPGLGRVDAIRRQDGRWVVVTSKGLIVAR